MRFAFRISKENVTLFYNCNETETMPVQRHPLELEFDSASTLYLAQAGPRIGEPYEVSDFLNSSIDVMKCQRKTWYWNCTLISLHMSEIVMRVKNITWNVSANFALIICFLLKSDLQNCNLYCYCNRWIKILKIN